MASSERSALFLDEGFEILDEAECLRLAASRRVGRVVVCVNALPAVFPLNFMLDGSDVLFRAATGTKLAAATHREVVAFQVDDFDAAGIIGWSVQVIGRADVVPAGDELRLPPVRHEQITTVRISGELITGRRLG